MPWHFFLAPLFTGWHFLAQTMAFFSFQEYVLDTMARLSSPPATLHAEVTRNWAEVVSRDFDFDWRQRVHAVLESGGVTKGGLQEFLRRLLFSEEGRRKLSVQVVAKAKGEEEEEEELLSDLKLEEDRSYELEYLHRQSGSRNMVKSLPEFIGTLEPFPMAHPVKETTYANTQMFFALSQ